MIRRATPHDSDQDYYQSIAQDPETELANVIRAAQNFRAFLVKEEGITRKAGEKELLARILYEMDIKFRGML